MSSCDTKTYINIKDLPQIFNITAGDYLIVENPQGTSILDYKDFIITADQLSTVSTTLTTLSVDIATLSAEVKGVSNSTLPAVMNVRMSFSSAQPTPTTSLTGTNASVLYIHPFKGDTVTLYDTSLSAWQAYDFNTIISAPLASICNVANTCYDIYLSISNNAYKITSRPWSNSNAQSIDFNDPRETQYVDGVPLHPTDRSMRLIGSIRTVAAGQSELNFGTSSIVGGSSPKIFLYNIYNQQAATFSIIDTGTYNALSGFNIWTSTLAGQTALGNGPFEAFGGTGNRISFITREQNTITLNTATYTLSNIAWYSGYSLDNAAPTVSQLRSALPGIPIIESNRPGVVTNSMAASIQPGYHFIQLVSMTYATQGNQQFITWSGDSSRYSYGTTGVLFKY